MKDDKPSVDGSSSASGDVHDAVPPTPIIVDAEPDDERIENADESVERAGW